MRVKSLVALLSLALALAGPVVVFAQDNAPPPGSNASAAPGSPDTSTAAAPGQPQVTQPDQNGVNWKGVGVGAGTVASNVFYIPAKLAYGILGGIAGGAGYVLTGGNRQVSDTIWRSSLGGDYVVTPDMVTGKDPVHFSGPTQTATADQSADANQPSANPDGSAVAPNPNLPAVAPTSPTAGTSSSIPPPASATTPNGVGGTRPIDSGAGPVKGASPITTSSLPGDSSAAPASGSSYPTYPGDATAPAADSGSVSNPSSDSSKASTPKLKEPPLPDTSIE